MAILETLSFVIPGPPKGKGRPRFARQAGIAFTPKDTVMYENLVKNYFRVSYPDWVPTDKPIMIYIEAGYPIPKSMPKGKQERARDQRLSPAKTPDWENIGKIISDALNQLAYKDDRQIVDGRVRKVYTEAPETAVVIKVMDE